MKLGKQPARHDPRTLRLARYLLELPELPPVSDWTQGVVAFGAMANDILGDCVCATFGHAIQIMTQNAGDATTVPDADVVALYSAVTGYDPADPSTDQGTVTLDALNYMRKVGLGGHRIDAYAAIDPKNHEHVKAAIHLFGGVAIGLQFLEGWETADVWSLPNGPVVGGHEVWACGYSSEGLRVISWGRLYTVPWATLDALCDEAHVVLSPDWIMDGDEAPSAVDLAALQQDLVALGR